jgi:pyruvate dehydrogenase E2 component (dihydrolipoamide acetyltransferase)
MTVAAYLLAPGEANPGAPAAHANFSYSGKAMPAARKLAKDKGLDLSRIKPSGPNGTVLFKDVETAVAGGASAASHLAKIAADRQGVNLAGLQGSGVRGRIMLADVEAATASLHKTHPISYKSRVQAMSSMRKTIARRLSESAVTAPHIHFFADVFMDPLMAYRKQVLPLFEKTTGLKLSVNDLLIKAVALTLREFPEVNASCVGEAIHYHDFVHMGLAVAVPGGLLVPAITDADTADLAHIATQRVDLVERARAGKITADELSLGTFTISSLAQGCVRQFTAIINPPQAGILSVPAIREELFLKDNGEVGKRRVITLGLSVDHRIVDGAIGSDFMQALKDKLEAPAFTFTNI